MIFTYDIRPSLIIDLKILSCIAHRFGKGTWQPFLTFFQNANFLSSPCTSACCNGGTIARPNYYHIIMRTKFIVIRRKSWKLRAILQNDVELIRKRLFCNLYIGINFLFILLWINVWSSLLTYFGDSEPWIDPADDVSESDDTDIFYTWVFKC